MGATKRRTLGPKAPPTRSAKGTGKIKGKGGNQEILANKGAKPQATTTTARGGRPKTRCTPQKQGRNRNKKKNTPPECMKEKQRKQMEGSNLAQQHGSTRRGLTPCGGVPVRSLWRPLLQRRCLAWFRKNETPPWGVYVLFRILVLGVLGLACSYVLLACCQARRLAPLA